MSSGDADASSFCNPASPAAMRTASSVIFINPASHADTRAASSSSYRSCPPPPEGLGATCVGTAVRRSNRRECLHHPQPGPTRGSYPIGQRVRKRCFGGEQRRRGGQARPHPGAACSGLQRLLHLPHRERDHARPPGHRGGQEEDRSCPPFPKGGGGKAAAYRQARPPGRRGGQEETADVAASPRGGQEAAKPAAHPQMT